MKTHKYAAVLRALFLCLLLPGSVLAQQADSSAIDLREVDIQSDGNTLAFVQTEFTVKASESVRLVFQNQATTPGLSHNVVIMTKPEDINRVGVAAIQAVANDYIPEDDGVLFHTPLAKSGETVELTFTAPAKPGDYPYACTFPGHYVLMRGVMHVVEN